MPTDAVLFIDANQYLTLYGLVAGKKLLDSLEEQQAHIFVTSQVVDEVLRNKLRFARTFFLDKFKDLDLARGVVPDHLLGISDEKTTEFKKSLEHVAKVKAELTTITADVLAQISRSEDEVSRRLAGLFDKSVNPSGDELQKARERRERGNPPGKPNYPLGDQITWEQLLTYCKEKHRIWIITSDTDFCMQHARLVLLNPFLYRDLTVACGSAPEVYCFSNLLTGLEHFGKNAGVEAEKLPTQQESSEIKREIDALPPVVLMTGKRDYVLVAEAGSYGLSGGKATLTVKENENDGVA